MATPVPIPVPKMSILEKLTQLVYLDYVLKAGGVALFVLALFGSWHVIGFLHKFEIFAGVAAWFVGARFSKIYR